MPDFRFPACLLFLLLSACGGNDADQATAASGDSALPQPGAVSGSVTGMPDPGRPTMAPAPAADETTADETPTAGAEPMPATEDVDAVPATDEPGPDAAVAVIRDYYASINAKDFARAHAAWRNNPQDPAQFAAGFAGTAGVSVEIGPPGPVDAGAGQCYIEIPVRLDLTRADGRLERHTGRYTLQRSVIEGGDPQWKIVRSTLSPP